MKIFGERVLVRQTMTRKKSNIILPGNVKAPDQFLVKQEVTMLSPDYQRGQIAIGDVPIFGRYANLNDLKIVEEVKDKEGQVNKKVCDIIVHVDDIIGVDDADSEGVVSSLEKID